MFTHPWVLLLLVVPVALTWSATHRAPGVVMPFDYQQPRPRRWLERTLLSFELAPLAFLAVAIVILAGPRALQATRPERQLTNIQIVMDVSGSMRWSAGGGSTRYEIAAEAVKEFTQAREGDAFGLIIFGSQRLRWVPLTRDLSAIRNAMPFADPKIQPEHMQGTHIANALLYARDQMVSESEAGDRLIILVSDGDSQDFGGGRDVEAARALAEARITLFHVHVANTSIPPEVLAIARHTGGESLAANDLAGLRRVFEHIDQMKPATFRSIGAAPSDNFRPFAIACLALLGVHGLGLSWLRYTPW